MHDDGRLTNGREATLAPSVEKRASLLQTQPSSTMPTAVLIAILE